MNKLKDFIKTEKGRKIVVSSIAGIIAISFYFIYTGGENKNSSSDVTSGEIIATSKDTTLVKKEHHPYYRGNRKKKEVNSDKDFFNRISSKSIIEEMDSLDLEVKNNTNDEEDDLQRVADSIKNANLNKVNYGPTSNEPVKSKPKKTNNSYSPPKYTSKKNKSVESEFDDFFGNEKLVQEETTEKKVFSENIVVRAVINGDQEVANGDRVEMRLVEPFIYNGIEYDVNTIFYGIATFRKKRIDVKISTIKHTNIAFKVFDEEDGMAGIHTRQQNILGETKETATDEIIEDDEEVDKVPFGKTIKNIFKRRKDNEEIKVPLLNNTRIRLKINS